MAIRNIRKFGEDCLRKKCREVAEIDKRVICLIDDLIDTMKAAEGVGLAAPQVGIIKRIAVVDIGDGVVELINPVIIEKSGEDIGSEGCLSNAGVYGTVKRPAFVKVFAKDRHGNERIIAGEGLLARALCHEIDHLDGKLFSDFVIEYVDEK